uniref:BPTI/Kunitz inhibitor domain-containing protein n=1 Tax=Haplochromis burtoni TaxID=8153 RepID=A0A3Q2VLF6_HAPBU
MGFRLICDFKLTPEVNVNASEILQYIISFSTDFCLLPPDVGQGTSFTLAVHYDVNKDQCTPFLYNGEGGNANRFENERESSKGCTLEKAEVECNGKYLRYYYDSTDKKCKRFSWTGCLGNGNRFFDYNSCNFTCAVVQGEDSGVMVLVGLQWFCSFPPTLGNACIGTNQRKKKREKTLTILFTYKTM